MAQIQFEPIKYLGNLPEFNGDNRDLQTFLNLIDRIHPILQTYDELSQGLFSDLIKSKLKGKAREIIEINCQATSWNDIKAVLQNNFGDRLSCDELFDSLRATTFKTTSLDFFDEIKSKLRRLNNKTLFVLGQELGAASTIAQNNSRTALNIFKSKIPEPMKTILACRNPNTLEGAMNILFEAGYAHLRIDNQQPFTRKKPEQNKSNFKQNQHQQNFKPHNFNQNFNSQNNPSFNHHRQNFQRRHFDQQNFNQNFKSHNNPNHNSHNQNSQQQNFNQNTNPQNNSNFNHNRQNFTSQNRTFNRFPIPEPMDVNVNFSNVGINTSNFNPQRNFAAQNEVYNQYNHNNYGAPYSQPPSENFHPSASEDYPI
ncbi:GATA zinc finger domain-containing protein 14-like [Teleopsis dalmanni]|uniref:GATA zinc finger domain-containing protein 14-like n=1 Tax=Teleopsis dalmanni TaxID=139649 RepID=UPI0018CDBBD1|nr:GATA zinc finger domain-containing protein 14-like [Teleopsis dalmanni]XP_037931371.1 GATA zinc finger domain-containing protein 14-like [Teleopsis dalmanni]